MKAAAAAQRHRERILDFLEGLDDTTIDTIARQGRYTVTPDGYPASTMSDGMPTGTSEYSGVESVVDRRAFAGTASGTDTAVKRPAPDPTGDAIRQLFAILADLAKLADRGSVKLAFIRHVKESASGRQTTTAGSCQCCGREVAGTPADRLRNGYCDTDYRAWLRDDRPERQPWEQQRRRAADVNQSVVMILDAVQAGALDVPTPSTGHSPESGIVPARFDQSA